jgi:hypothetical protein
MAVMGNGGKVVPGQGLGKEKGKGKGKGKGSSLTQLDFLGMTATLSIITYLLVKDPNRTFTNSASRGREKE